MISVLNNYSKKWIEAFYLQNKKKKKHFIKLNNLKQERFLQKRKNMNMKNSFP